MSNYNDASEQKVNAAIESAWLAFGQYRKTTVAQRANFLRAIAVEIEAINDILLETAMAETNLAKDRLQGEIKRTLFQLTSYAAYCEQGDWLQVRIDRADLARIPPKPDIRKTKVPLGPVVVFGASNFPFAYSTAGGDTASAFAAGCTVVVKAHPAHPKTSELVAGAINAAVEKSGLPAGVFSHIYGASTQVGQWLVTHPHVKAVGFTGSFGGGKALFDWANQRPEPIPVFAEMGSVNPVYLFDGKLTESAVETAKIYASSITLSCGQFCTNPGLIIGITGPALSTFKAALAAAIAEIAPQPMLHAGIANAFWQKRDDIFKEAGVNLLAESIEPPVTGQGQPTIAMASAADFIGNNKLHQEIFGPYSLLIECKDYDEMALVASVTEGQLTSTLIATADDVLANGELVETIKEKCGRIIMNGVPTGVEVSLAMHHGGPYPATTDSRFTAVGGDAIGRFARPLSFQNWPNELLPAELRD
jgi:NADP-dependent aldehyde dehydrogenase